MKKFFKFQLLALVLATVFFVSCSDDEGSKPEYPSLKGAFVVNQGDFSKNNGAISFYGDDGTVDKDIFKSVNNHVLGDVVQDFEVVDTLGFIVVNGSQKVEVVRMRDFKSIATIDHADLTYPRYVVQANDNTVYISNGAKEGYVIVYSLATMSVVGKISVGNGPEMMARVGNKMYVANSGGFGVDKTVSVIDIEKGEVIKTIVVDESSVALKADSEDNIWVYSKGNGGEAWVFSDAKLFKINTNTDEVEKTFALPGTIGSYGSNLFAISKEGDIYYIVDGVYKMNINDDNVPAAKWKDYSYFGIEVDPKTGKVYGLDSNNKKIEIMEPGDATVSSTLSETYSYPHSIYFNK